jgi:hypothetical protein
MINNRIATKMKTKMAASINQDGGLHKSEGLGIHPLCI